MFHVPSAFFICAEDFVFRKRCGIHNIPHASYLLFICAAHFFFSTSLQFIMLCTGVCLGQCVSSIPCEIEIK